MSADQPEKGPETQENSTSTPKEDLRKEIVFTFGPMSDEEIDRDLASQDTTDPDGDSNQQDGPRAFRISPGS